MIKPFSENNRSKKSGNAIKLNNSVGNSAGDNVVTDATGKSDVRDLLPVASADPLLTFPQKSRTNANLANFSLESIGNIPAMPFHHLIPAPLLGLNSSFNQNHSSAYQSGNSTHRKQLFWQSLAATGISPREAALFDDSIECSFIEFNGGNLLQVDWEALHYDALEGCGELYLAEMFTCKQRIYEAADAFPKSMEFSSDDLTAYLPEEIFSSLARNVFDLFFNSLSANFTLTVSRINVNSIGSRQRAKRLLFSELFESYLTEGASRTTGWNCHKSSENDKHKGTYTVSLSDYWLDWQKAAHLAKFDFDFLTTLTDARAVRFYELTKLWRVPSGNRTDTATDQPISISRRLEIEYRQFVSLMPLPGLKGERQIKRQINELIKPLRAAGYVKSFRLEPDQSNSSGHHARIVFHFND